MIDEKQAEGGQVEAVVRPPDIVEHAERPNAKRQTFLIYDERFGTEIITGGVDSTLYYFRQRLEEVVDGAAIVLKIKRRDMSEQELIREDLPNLTVEFLALTDTEAV